MLTVNDLVTVTDTASKYHGKSGRVMHVQKDGTLLVDGLKGWGLDHLVGWPALRPDQLRYDGHWTGKKS